ncbi:MAG: hypothetical protein Q4F95_07790 [Oscillospiraceae bacterium]|nr:hypothetical protein [Oscillospiraceae bacterium]
MTGNKRLHGSAILWAVCTLMIFMVILTGILSLNKRYMNEEIYRYSDKQAEFSARSGIDIVSAAIIDSSIPVTSNQVDLKFDDSSGCTVTIEQNLGSIELRSVAQCGTSEYTLVGLMKKNKAGTWELTGYVTY